MVLLKIESIHSELITNRKRNFCTGNRYFVFKNHFIVFFLSVIPQVIFYLKTANEMTKRTVEPKYGSKRYIITLLNYTGTVNIVGVFNQILLYFNAQVRLKPIQGDIFRSIKKA